MSNCKNASTQGEYFGCACMENIFNTQTVQSKFKDSFKNLCQFSTIYYGILCCNLMEFMLFSDNISEIACYSMAPKQYFIKQANLRCSIYSKRLDAKAVQKERDKQTTK